MSSNRTVVFVSRTASYAVAGLRDHTALLALGSWLLASLGGWGPAPLSRSRAAGKVAPWQHPARCCPQHSYPDRRSNRELEAENNWGKYKFGVTLCDSFLSNQGSICNLRYLSQTNGVVWLGSLKGRRSRCLEFWRRIIWYTGTNVAEKRSAFIFSPHYLHGRFPCNIGIYY